MTISVDYRKEKIESMCRFYPSLRLVEDEGKNVLVWKGTLTPIRSTNDIDEILSDIENDQPVEIIGGEFAEIVHHSECKLAHPPHPLTPIIKQPIREFQVRVVDFCTDRQPEATVIESPIPASSWKHRSGETGVCAYAPWEHPWNRDKSPIDFVDHVLIWLFKQNVYSQTGKWLGKETQHDEKFLLSTLKPSDPCPCGLDKSFKDCHRFNIGKQLYEEYWVAFETWDRYRSIRYT